MENRITTTNIGQFHAKLVEDEKSEATIEKYLRDVEAFFSFVGGDAVTKETAIQYKEHLKKKYKPASVNSMLAAVNRFFREMGWFGCIVKALKILCGGSTIPLHRERILHRGEPKTVRKELWQVAGRPDKTLPPGAAALMPRQRVISKACRLGWAAEAGAGGRV